MATKMQEQFMYSKELPLASPEVPWITAVVYTALVLLLARLNALKKQTNAETMKQSMLVRFIGTAHNAMLSVASLALFVYTLLAMKQSQLDARSLVCFEPSSKAIGPIWQSLYLYYLSKFLELADTALLLLKGKSLNTWGGLLHVFHHALVLPMAHMWLHFTMSTAHFGLLTNCFVHVPMYAYFALSEMGIKPSWGKHITKLQLVQFGISFAFFVWMLLEHFQLHSHRCAGMPALIYNICFNAILFVLFFGVHKRKSQHSDKEAEKHASKQAYTDARQSTGSENTSENRRMSQSDQSKPQPPRTRRREKQ